MKPILTAFFLIFVYLQYRLWIGDGSIAALVQLQDEIEKQSAENAHLQERNRLLAAEVFALKNDADAIEERARTDLGMIKKGETFFMVLQPASNKTSHNTL
ncbi:MAG: cell division protein FtsB [Cellvibrionaceae bacterium]|nr:cell division protein FtsB [Cellvibrionaceae bacterium]